MTTLTFTWAHAKGTEPPRTTTLEVADLVFGQRAILQHIKDEQGPNRWCLGNFDYETDEVQIKSVPAKPYVPATLVWDKATIKHKGYAGEHDEAGAHFHLCFNGLTDLSFSGPHQIGISNRDYYAFPAELVSRWNAGPVNSPFRQYLAGIVGRTYTFTWQRGVMEETKHKTSTFTTDPKSSVDLGTQLIEHMNAERKHSYSPWSLESWTSVALAPVHDPQISLLDLARELDPEYGKRQRSELDPPDDFWQQQGDTDADAWVRRPSNSGKGMPNLPGDSTNNGASAQ